MAKNQRQRLNSTTRSSDPAVQRIKAIPMIVCAVATGLATSLVWVSTGNHHSVRVDGATVGLEKPSPALALMDSLLAPPSVPADAEIALLNLACAPPSSNARNRATISDHLRVLDQWAAVVADQTVRNFHRYRENPLEFNSEAEWRMAMMVTVLAQDFKVRYDPTLTSTAQQTASNRVFFSNPDSIFLTGCLSDSRIGTCASLPVLYVAIGQRLGYPMHLVAAKSHLFARWDDGKGTRVNLEAANAGGYVSHPDSHYRTWPFPITPQEEKSGGYLQNLTNSQALAIFLSTRAVCLQSTGKSADAIAAASAAFRLAPNLGGIQDSLRQAISGTRPSAQQDLAELQYMQQMARMQAAMDPTDPTPRINMPGSYVPPSTPARSLLPQPGSPSPGVPSSQFPQPQNPYAPR